jgi:hypothetical protein
VDALEEREDIIGPKYPHEESYLPSIVASSIPLNEMLSAQLIKTYWKSSPPGLPREINFDDLVLCQKESCAYIMKRIPRRHDDEVKRCLMKAECAFKGLSGKDTAFLHSFDGGGRGGGESHKSHTHIYTNEKANE